MSAGSAESAPILIILIVETSLDVFSTSLVLLVEIQKPTPKQILRRTDWECYRNLMALYKYFSTPKILSKLTCSIHTDVARLYAVFHK